METNKRTTFFYIFLVDFLIAAQFVLFSVFPDDPIRFEGSWLMKTYLLSFLLSFFVFCLFSSASRSYEENEKILKEGLVFFMLGNIICLFFSQSDLFILGITLAGLATGMIFLSQVGMIWMLEDGRLVKLSFRMTAFSSLGFFLGPYVASFLSGSNMSRTEVFFALGAAVAFLAVFSMSQIPDKIFSVSSFIIYNMLGYIKRKRQKLALFMKKKKKGLSIIEIIHEKFWITFKFSALFFIVAWFVSQYARIEISLLAAALITALSIAYNRIFDSASDAFLDVEENDGAEDKAKKTIVVILKRFFYTMLDYGLAFLSVALVVAAINLHVSFLTAIAAMWLIIDLPSAAILVGIYEKTGRDMTLGRSYRRMANSILAQSKIAGVVVFIYEITLASFWSGPDFTVIFFKDELKTKIRTIIALLIITMIHAVLWTSVYWYGYEDIIGLVERFLNGG